MRRREFVKLLAGSALAQPLTAWAQPTTKVYRLAILHPSRPVAKIVEDSSVRDWREFFGELRRLGYVEGQNIVIERYSGEGQTDNYRALGCVLINFAHECLPSAASHRFAPRSGARSR